MFIIEKNFQLYETYPPPPPLGLCSKSRLCMYVLCILTRRKTSNLWVWKKNVSYFSNGWKNNLLFETLITNAFFVTRHAWTNGNTVGDHLHVYDTELIHFFPVHHASLGLNYLHVYILPCQFPFRLTVQWANSFIWAWKNFVWSTTVYFVSCKIFKDILRFQENSRTGKWQLKRERIV